MKLSPHYRNDSDDAVDPELREYLDENYLIKLQNISVRNPKLLVVFAGGNAVGKTALAEKIEQEFHGLRLENDGVKRVILQRNPELAMTDELNHMTWLYTMDLYRRLDTVTANGLVIRDGIITWYYDRILPIFEQRDYEIFVVAWELSEAKMLELIAVRGDTPTSTAAWFRETLPEQIIHLQRFLKHYQPDVVLRDESVFDHGAVIDALRRKLDSLD